ncbi:hypothetical protein SNE40_015223 [Patella caerulea]|uniref:Methyltransferase domain-containing protein n=1 Tax=Patella caerulea TaxID=87958 RepID=A0AAN8JKM6_PATCE
MSNVGNQPEKFTLQDDFEERRKLNPTQMVAKIDEWVRAGKYEDDMDSIGNQGYHIVSRTVGDYYKTNRENIKVIDVAAGTGLVSLELKKLGFKEMDAVDASEEMMKVAIKRNIFNKYYVEYVDGHRLPIETDTYDCAVVSGGFSQSFLPCNALFEIVRIVKPGGIICIEMIESNLNRVPEFVDRLEPLWKKFAVEGVWEVLKKDIIPELVTGENGLLMIYKVLTSEISFPQLPPL